MKELLYELEQLYHEKNFIKSEIDRRLTRFFEKAINSIIKNEISELNFLELINEITDNSIAKTKILCEFVKYAQVNNTKFHLIEKTLAERYLEEAKKNITFMNLFELDFMHNLFHKLNDEKKLQEFKMLFTQNIARIENAWKKEDKKSR